MFVFYGQIFVSIKSYNLMPTLLLLPDYRLLLYNFICANIIKRLNRIFYTIISKTGNIQVILYELLKCLLSLLSGSTLLGPIIISLTDSQKYNLTPTLLFSLIECSILYDHTQQSILVVLIVTTYMLTYKLYIQLKIYLCVTITALNLCQNNARVRISFIEIPVQQLSNRRTKLTS